MEICIFILILLVEINMIDIKNQGRQTGGGGVGRVATPPLNFECDMFQQFFYLYLYFYILKLYVMDFSLK